MKKSVTLRVQPKAKQEKIVSVGSSSFKVYTHKPAVDGKANKRVVELLAEYLGVKRNQIIITKGARSRDKVAVVTYNTIKES